MVAVPSESRRLPTAGDLLATNARELHLDFELPTQDELPCDDGEPMETQRHKWQMDLLLDTLDRWLEIRTDGFASGNMFLYFSSAQIKKQDFRGPDFFAVLDVPKGERKSWVVWEEEKAPDVVIELLSESTANLDKTEKKLIYQNKLRVSEYFWYDPFNPSDFAGFVLQNGIYHPLQPTSQGWFVSDRMGLMLVLWEGTYRGVTTTWLRWATLEGSLLSTGQELAKAAEETAKTAEKHAEIVQERADRLAAKLRDLGIDPEDL